MVCQPAFIDWTILEASFHQCLVDAAVREAVKRQESGAATV